MFTILDKICGDCNLLTCACIHDCVLSYTCNNLSDFEQNGDFNCANNGNHLTDNFNISKVESNSVPTCSYGPSDNNLTVTDLQLSKQEKAAKLREFKYSVSSRV